MMKTIILSLLSLVFLSGCGPNSYTKPLVEADEYLINQDLLGTWLPPNEEGKKGDPPLMIYKFSDTEYLFTMSSDLEAIGFRAYEIEFKEKKYLQVESIFWEDEVSTVGGHNFYILQYSLSGDNLKLSTLYPTVWHDNKHDYNPANDIQREFKELVTLKRQIDQ